LSDQELSRGGDEVTGGDKMSNCMQLPPQDYLATFYHILS